MCYISLHRRCEDNSNDLILLRDKQESQTSICLRAVGRGNGCGKRRSGRGESKARNTAKCICSLGSLLLPPRQLLSGAFLQGLVLSLKTTAKSLTHSAQIQSPDIYSCFHNISEHLSINLSCKATIPQLTTYSLLLREMATTCSQPRDPDPSLLICTHGHTSLGSLLPFSFTDICLFHLTGEERCLSWVSDCIWWSLLGLEATSNTVLLKASASFQTPARADLRELPKGAVRKSTPLHTPGAERRGHSYTGPSLVSSAPHTVEPSETHLASPRLLFSSINSKQALVRFHPKSYVMVKEDYKNGNALPAAMY